MYSTLSVHFLPSLTSAEELAAGVVVMVDVLRASTTITAALASGAKEVIPCLEIDEARQKAAKWGATHASEPPLLGGERGGLPIEGFHLGNSPRDYSPEAVRHRSIIFTTTNGTQALKICNAAAQVLIGAPVNFSAVVAQLKGDKPIHLLCAGTRGKITREDVFFTGAIVEKLTGVSIAETDINDEARMARDVWQNGMGDIRPPGKRANQRIAEVLLQTQGGINLTSVGLQADIAEVADFDRYDFAPEFDVKNWKISRP